MTKARVVCITQARMTSTRLPGKVMLPLHGKPMLQWHLERLLAARCVDLVAVATPDMAESAPIVELVEALGVPLTRGPEHDVLARYTACAEAHRAEVVVRVTSDCPLIDPQLVDLVVDRFGQGDVDYVSLDIGSYPRGLDVEVFSRAALDEAFARAADPAEREHVTPYIYRRPERFRLAKVAGGRGAEYRLCVDQADDFELVRRLLDALDGRPDFGWRDVVALLDAHPDWAALNQGVAQKTV